MTDDADLFVVGHTADDTLIRKRLEAMTADEIYCAKNIHQGAANHWQDEADEQRRIIAGLEAHYGSAGEAQHAYAARIQALADAEHTKVERLEAASRAR
jgi:hypothetical protein